MTTPTPEDYQFTGPHYYCVKGNVNSHCPSGEHTLHMDVHNAQLFTFRDAVALDLIWTLRVTMSGADNRRRVRVAVSYHPGPTPNDLMHVTSAETTVFQIKEF